MSFQCFCFNWVNNSLVQMIIRLKLTNKLWNNLWYQRSCANSLRPSPKPLIIGWSLSAIDSIFSMILNFYFITKIESKLKYSRNSINDSKFFRDFLWIHWKVYKNWKKYKYYSKIQKLLKITNNYIINKLIESRIDES